MSRNLATLILFGALHCASADFLCSIRLDGLESDDGRRSAARTHPCSPALFRASRNVQIKDRIREAVVVSSGSNLFCDPPLDHAEALAHTGRSWQRVAVARRGQCSFQRKAEVASALGYQGLVIVNVDNSTFPFGDASPDLSAWLIPTVMAPAALMMDLLQVGEVVSSLSALSSPPSSQLLSAGPCSPVAPSLNAGETAMTAVLCRLEDIQITLETDVIYADTWVSRYLTSLSDVPSKLPRLAWGIIVAACLVLFPLVLPNSLLQTPFIFRLMQNLLFIAAVLGIVLLSVFLKVGTFRTVGGELAGLGLGVGHTDAEGRRVVFDHRETDERVFETLILAVSRDVRHYRLTAQDLRRLGLAEENYLDDIFIHPPVFVYLSAALMRIFDVSMPAIPIIMHAATLLLIPVLTHLALWRRSHLARLDTTTPTAQGDVNTDIWGYAKGASLWAMLVYCMCPVASFCSQKLWIDNAAALTATLSATAHLGTQAMALRNLKSADKPSHCMRAACRMQFISGLVFGGIALNTKLPNLALLPFIAMTSLPTALEMTKHQMKGDMYSYRNMSMVVVKYIGAFILGAVLGHGPWIALYRSKTGRWLPNAWPSASMLAASPFLQRAVEKGAGAYMGVLLRFAPVYLVGLAAPVLGLGYTVLRDTGFSVHRLLRHVTFHMIDLWALPVGFLVGLSMLAAMGAGAQSRFMLPALPALAVLVGISASEVASNINKSPHGYVVPHFLSPLIALLIAYGAFHSLWYGICFPSLYADLDTSITDVITTMLASPLVPPPSRVVAEAALAQLRHFGLNISTA